MFAFTCKPTHGRRSLQQLPRVLLVHSHVPANQNERVINISNSRLSVCVTKMAYRELMGLHIPGHCVCRITRISLKATPEALHIWIW